MTCEYLQARLKSAGYDPGPLDGDLGPKTYAALLDYTAGRKLGELGTRLARGMAGDFPKYAITSPLRVIHFLAQAAHETGAFRYLTELGNAAYFAKYDGRDGNTEPGDGARYRGRGIFQNTFRPMYRKTGARIGVDLEANPERMAEPEIAVTAACLYWTDHGLNEYADRNDGVSIGRAINRGNAKSSKPANGEAERLAYVAKLKGVWGV